MVTIGQESMGRNSESANTEETRGPGSEVTHKGIKLARKMRKGSVNRRITKTQNIYIYIDIEHKVVLHFIVRTSFHILVNFGNMFGRFRTQKPYMTVTTDVLECLKITNILPS